MNTTIFSQKIFEMAMTSFALFVQYRPGSHNFLQDTEILDWCPAGSVLPHGEAAVLGHPTSDSITTQYLIGQMFYYMNQFHTPSFSTGLVQTESASLD